MTESDLVIKNYHNIVTHTQKLMHDHTIALGVNALGIGSLPELYALHFIFALLHFIFALHFICI